MARIRSLKPSMSDLEAAEFRGLFFGEGSIDLVRQGITRGLSPRLRLSLRSDDREVLHWIHDRLGGSLSHVDRSHMPGYGDVIVWQLTGRVAVSAAVAYLEGGSLPSKKRAELALLREALLLVPRPGQHIDDAAVVRQHEIREELKTVRRFERSA